jgi:prepilin-type N-terminal cleavage/methylation domain-containing protein
MRKNKTIRGLTLSELLVAAAILAIAVSGLLALLITCVLANKSNNNLVVATNDAQYVLEAMKGLSYGDVSSCNYTPPALSNLTDEQITVACTDETSMTKITVTVQWKERDVQKNLQLSTRIAQ